MRCSRPTCSASCVPRAFLPPCMTRPPTIKYAWSQDRILIRAPSIRQGPRSKRPVSAPSECGDAKRAARFASTIGDLMKMLRLILVLGFACSAGAQRKSGAAQKSNPDKVSSSLIEVFDTFDLVALGEWHDRQEDHDLRVRLIHHPDFSQKVRNIVVECGNSLYQRSLDRYVDGQDVPKGNS